MEMVNPLAAFREGWDTTQGLFDARTRKQAGNALAQGDYRGGANALLGGGMLDEGTQLLQYDQRNQQAQAEAEKARAQEAKAAQVGALKTMVGGAQSLLQVPSEQRRQAWAAQVRPLLEQQGVPPELLAKFDQSGFTDQELQPFITTLGGELQKPEWQIVNQGSGQGVIAVDQRDPRNRQVITEPDPHYADYQQARIDATRAQVAQREAAAAKSRRGPAGRRGGGSGSKLPAGFILDAQ